MKNKNYKVLKVNLIIICLSMVIILISMFAPLFLFTLAVCVLLYDYFVLLGGNLYWLNRIIDDKDFHGTGIYRRMLAVDAKMIVIAIISGLWILFLSDSMLSEYGDAHRHISIYEYLTLMQNNSANITYGIPIFFYTVIIKLFMMGQLIHSIHHIIINEKLTGMKFSGYAPITMSVKKLIIWARK